MENKIICGDCMELLAGLPSEHVDLVLTSPPYAEQRKNLYQSIAEEDYPQWTVSWMERSIPILKASASIAIIIRPHLHQGSISDYVLKTRLAIRAAGWYECEELIWIKPNSPPLGSTRRPRRAWESILWFARSPKPFCDPKANGVQSNRVGFESKKGVGVYKAGTSKAKAGIARCKDYIEIGTSGVDRSPDNTHPAQYPVELAVWLINLLSPPGGFVLDPFIGSGTTAVASKKTGRKYLGIDISEDYCRYAEHRLAN